MLSAAPELVRVAARRDRVCGRRLHVDAADGTAVRVCFVIS